MTPPVAVKPLAEWPAGSRRIYEEYCQWLRDGGYSDATVYLYGRAARLALGWLDKNYRIVNPQADLESVRRAVAHHYDSVATCQTYFKGLAKLAEFLRVQSAEPAPRQVNWDYYLDPLPARLAAGVRAYVIHRQRSRLPDQRYRATCTLLSHLTLSLRWMVAHAGLACIEDLTPALWLEYVEARLAAGIRPTTLNRELRDWQHLLRFLDEEGRAICHRMLCVEPLRTGRRLPRDVSAHQLRQLLRQVEAGGFPGRGDRRQALLDHAWVLLMLHSGLRTGEIWRLRLRDLDLEAGRARIEQSKGLTDRMVCLSVETVAAISAYLAVRGPGTGDHVFLYRHRPLSPTYCGKRLHTLGVCCGLRATPHQLRASFATLLLNAGASVPTVQALLGHKHVDTTLRYARVYDQTVAADYVRALCETERRLRPMEGMAIPPEGTRQQQICRSAGIASTPNSRMRVGMIRDMTFI